MDLFEQIYINIGGLVLQEVKNLVYFTTSLCIIIYIYEQGVGSSLPIYSIDFDKISRAITNTYELMRIDEQLSEIALENLKEAEKLLSDARSYVLTKDQSVI